MKKLRLLGATCACLAILPFTAGASIVDSGTFLTDTSTGLDWLDTTATSNMSYDYVSSQLGTGGAFEGWRYATRSEVSTLWDTFGGDSNYSGWSVNNNGLFDAVAPLMGDLACVIRGCNPGDGFSHWITADVADAVDASAPHGKFTEGQHFSSILFDYYSRSESATMDYITAEQVTEANSFADPEYGSALVRISAVPVPAAVWLFASGLLGLVGVARRKMV